MTCLKVARPACDNDELSEVKPI